MTTELRIYNQQAEPQSHCSETSEIQQALDSIGVFYQRWPIKPLAINASSDEVLASYAEQIAELKQRYELNHIDVASIKPNNPKKDEMRQMFLSEHTHADFELRFFASGQGLFFLRPESQGQVYALRCSAGDLLSVPIGMRHWFDMGPQPQFTAIRFFSTEGGWKADFTGDDIASKFPSFEH